MAKLVTHQLTEGIDWLRTYWGSDLKRVFYIYNAPECSVRGFHRHHRCRMGMICVKGSVEIYVQTPEEDQHFRLDSLTQILLLDPTDWRVMHTFSSDAVLVVFADQIYMDTTYIDTSYRCCQLT